MQRGKWQETAGGNNLSSIRKLMEARRLTYTEFNYRIVRITETEIERTK